MQHSIKNNLCFNIFFVFIGCKQALFIFDEIDKMPEGLVDAVKPFIDYHEEVQVKLS